MLQILYGNCEMTSGKDQLLRRDNVLLHRSTQLLCSCKHFRVRSCQLLDSDMRNVQGYTRTLRGVYLSLHRNNQPLSSDSVSPHRNKKNLSIFSVFQGSV
ncbi:MAG TPA: hypothetical protein VKZ57_00050 [Sphingobacterium sp.]|nr:hypothetical protein [Sphingobacterium sp.]